MLRRLVLLLALTPAGASAATVCSAGDIRAAEGAANCPSDPTRVCIISKSHEVAMDGCIFDFGTQAVEILGGGGRRIDAGGFQDVRFQAGSITMRTLSEIRARGSDTLPHAGSLVIETLHDFQMLGSSKIDVSVQGNHLAGDVRIVSGGNTILEGSIDADAKEGLGRGGSVSITSAGDLSTDKTISARCPTGSFRPGTVDILADGAITIGGSLDVSGGDGGDISVESRGPLLIDATISADGSGDAGYGGVIELLSGRGVILNGKLQAQGNGGTGQTGGSGGSIQVEASYGDITVNDNATVAGGVPDGDGGDLSFTAAGSIVIASGTTMSARTDAGLGAGGDVTVEADIDVAIDGSVDASGGLDGGELVASAGRNLDIRGGVDARGRNPGAYGGTLEAEAGLRTRGVLQVNGTVDAGGGICGTEEGCGEGGLLFLAGCEVSLGARTSLQDRGAGGGDIVVQARGRLTVGPTVVINATTSVGSAQGVDGTIHYEVPAAATLSISPLASVQPPALLEVDPELVACGTCGNGSVEAGETCDDGNSVGCDGCSFACEIEDCDDGNRCTIDACDNRLGCRGDPAPAGTSCCENGAPRDCSSLDGACVVGVCNPATDTCESHTAADGTACNDGLGCTTGDICRRGICELGSGDCSCVGDPNTPDDPCFGVVAVCGTGPSSCRVDLDLDTSSCTDPGLPGVACCGNEVLDPGEDCDAGTANSDDPDAACRTDCRPGRCGDGIVDPGRGELCDDGNLDDGDTCSSQCLPPPSPTHTAQASPTATLIPTATPTPEPSATRTATATASATATPPSIPTSTATMPPSPTSTLVASPTATASPTPTPTATAAASDCPGDCSNDANVTVDEIVRCTNIALGTIALNLCQACDTSGDQQVTVDEIVATVNAALTGCR